MATQDNEYCQQVVPKKSKKSNIIIAFILINTTLFSASMHAGGELSLGLPLSQFLLLLFIGNLMLALYSALLGYIGAKTGFSTHLLARFSFGLKGSWLPSFLLSMTQIGWFGMGVAMFSYPLSKLINLNIYFIVIIFGLMMTLTVALKGIRGLFYLSMIAVSTVIIISCYFFWTLIDQIGHLSQLLVIKSTQSLSFKATITMIIGSFISVAILTADFVKLGRHAKQTFFLTVLAFLFINGLLFIFNPAGNVYLLIALFMMMMMLTVLLEGIKGLFYLSAIAVPTIALFGCYSIWIALNDSGLAALTINPLKKPISFCSALTLIIGSFISGGTLTADFTRFGRHDKNIFLITLFAFLFGNSLVFIFGAIGLITVGFADVSDVMIAQGYPFLGIVVLALNIWTTNNNALYTSGLGIANITGFSNKRLSIINGLLGTATAVWLYHHFLSWLTFLSTTIPPVGGIIIADYLLHSKKYNSLSYSGQKEINIVAFLATFIAIVGAFYLPGIIPVNAFLIAIISYTMLSLLFSLK